MNTLAVPLRPTTKPSHWRDGLPSLLLVGTAHAALLAAALLGLGRPTVSDFKPPTLSGVLVAEASQQVTPSLPTPKPPPKPAPAAQRKPPSPPVQAPQTERSITMPKAEEQEKPVPTPVDAPVAQEVSAAPTAPSRTTAPAETAAAPPVVPPLADANHLNNPAPVYPMGARRRNEQGVVYLTVLVLADGTVGDLSLKRSSGYPELDESALKAVARWRFVPASRGGKAIDWRYTLPISFSLNP